MTSNSANAAPGAWWALTTPDWVTYAERAEAACGEGPTSGTAFRGQSDINHTLKPSLLRLAEQVKLSPEKTLEVESRATKEFAAHAHLYAVAPPQQILGSIGWWPWMRHYGAPTRLLDWSLSPYIALYFAVASDWNCDGVVWGFAVGQLRDRMTAIYGVDNATSDRELLKQFCLPTAPIHVSVVSSESYSERMARQQGLFTICSHILSDHADAIGQHLPGVEGRADSFKLVIPKSAKPDFLRRLRRMNITALALFPGADGLGRSLDELVRLA